MRLTIPWPHHPWQTHLEWHFYLMELSQRATYRKNKGRAHSTPLSASSTDPQPEAPSLGLGGQGKIPSFPRRLQPIGASAPVAAPRKSKPKVWGLSILHSTLEVPLEVKLLASSKKPKSTSTLQNLVVWYNPCSRHIGGLPTGSIEMKEFKIAPDSPIERNPPNEVFPVLDNFGHKVSS